MRKCQRNSKGNNARRQDRGSLSSKPPPYPRRRRISAKTKEQYEKDLDSNEKLLSDKLHQIHYLIDRKKAKTSNASTPKTTIEPAAALQLPGEGETVSEKPSAPRIKDIAIDDD